MIALRVDDRVLAQVKDFDPADESELARQADASATGTSDFRAVARRS